MEQQKSPLCSEMSRLCLGDLDVNNLQENFSRCMYLKDNRQEDVGEAKTSRCEDDEEGKKENDPPIKKYLSVRKDLCDSSFTEEWTGWNSNQFCEPQVRLCLECSMVFDNWRALYLHQLQHENHRCPISVCGRRFDTRGELKKHIQTHIRNKPYRHGQCSKSVAKSSARRGQLIIYKGNVRSE